MEIIRTYQHHNNKVATYVRVRCDTDFVARNKEFLKFCDDLAMGLASLEDPWQAVYQENPVTGNVFMQDILEARKKFGEDIRLLQHDKFEAWEEPSETKVDDVSEMMTEF